MTEPDGFRTVAVALAHAQDDEPYEVLIGGSDVLDRARRRVRDLGEQIAVIADERVVELHGPLAADVPHLALPAGEATKSFDGLRRALDFCAASGLSRQSTLVAYGGGTIGDLVGLAASLYMRGIRVLQVPTTLLAQVDASVGGKTAINLDSGKNLAGTFHQPAGVFCVVDFLHTLPGHEFRSGLGEVVKSALIDGDEAFESLESEAKGLRSNTEALARAIERSVSLKARIVAADPRESGERKVLNLGHTFAHAIEHAAGYGVIPHGIAVGVGLVLAARASEATIGASPELAGRIAALLDSVAMPSSLLALRTQHPGVDLGYDRLLRGLHHDKKGRAGAPRFVLLRGPGDCERSVEVAPAILRDLFD